MPYFIAKYDIKYVKTQTNYVPTTMKRKKKQLWKLETQKLGLDRLAIRNFLNELPVFDTRIARNSKLETHLGNLVKTEPNTT